MLPKVVKKVAEDALVGPAVWVSNEHVHVPASHLPSSVRATGHTQQPRVEGLGCHPDLGKSRKDRLRAFA